MSGVPFVSATFAGYNYSAALFLGFPIFNRNYHVVVYLSRFGHIQLPLPARPPHAGFTPSRTSGAPTPTFVSQVYDRPRCVLLSPEYGRLHGETPPPSPPPPPSPEQVRVDLRRREGMYNNGNDGDGDGDDDPDGMVSGYRNLYADSTPSRTSGAPTPTFVSQVASPSSCVLQSPSLRARRRLHPPPPQDLLNTAAYMGKLRPPRLRRPLHLPSKFASIYDDDMECIIMATTATRNRMVSGTALPCAANQPFFIWSILTKPFDLMLLTYLIIQIKTKSAAAAKSTLTSLTGPPIRVNANTSNTPSFSWLEPRLLGQ
ncbi:hypothetical protein B0H16DRAFT_1713428 [Mycena metata]|uniref:Uncharacterized protein n=1 Tax=Mycena metata TaxID=1033252 RepID=A0AAD7JZ57_9AGAR|nr:hypothetical protein B0H16DRAFT_1713428 [Mycena metata]